MKNFGRFALQLLRRSLGNRRNRRNPRLARKSVGIARIDHHGPRRTALQALGAPVNRSRTGFGKGEATGNCCARCQRCQQHIGAVLVADAGFGNGQCYAVNGRKMWNRTRSER